MARSTAGDDDAARAAPATDVEEAATAPEPASRSRELLSKIPFSRHPTEAVRLFSSSPNEPRARRPTDVALLLLVVAVLAPLLWLHDAGERSKLGRSIIDFLDALPSVLDDVWSLAFDALILWGVVLIVMVIAARRWRLLRDLAIASALSAFLTVVAANIGGDSHSWFEAVADTDGPPVFPAARIALIAAIVVTASPHLTRSLRWIGRLVVVTAGLSVVFLNVALPAGALGGYLVGVAAAAITHLVVGSPGGRPTREQVASALADIGLTGAEVGEVEWLPDGVAAASVRCDGDELRAKVYGRDAWNAGWMSGLWRFLWYRDGGSINTASRRQLVEREGFVTLLAERSGVLVREVVAAGVSVTSDALLVVRTEGVPVEAVDEVSSDVVTDAWHELVELHGAGIAHGRLDRSSVFVDGDHARLGDFAAAVTGATPGQIFSDRAQLLVLTSLALEPGEAVRLARTAIGTDALAEALPYLQDAALTDTLRKELKHSEISVDMVRDAVEEATGVTDPELEKLQRVTWGSVLQMGLLAFAVWALISGLSDLGLDSIVDELRSAIWAWLAVALIIAQLPRFAQGFSTLGASPRPLPLGPVTALQFAITYINLAVPSTAARVAVNVRFFRKLGLPTGAAVSIGALDSVAGFVVQVFLIVFILVSGLATLDIGLDINTADAEKLALLAVVVAVVAIGVVAFVKPLRRRVATPLKEATSVLVVLRSPYKALLMFGGNFVSQILFAVAILCCLRAFGESASIAELVLINTLVTTFASVIPVPGGIGVSEAGLTAGLVSLGIPEATAFAAAITYRFASFYLPPIWGFFAFNWLQKNKYL